MAKQRISTILIGISVKFNPVNRE